MLASSPLPESSLARAFQKRADPVGTTPHLEEQANADRASLIRKMVNVGLGTAGLTAAGVGGVQMLRWLTAAQDPTNDIGYAPTELDLRIPVKRRKQKPLLTTPTGLPDGMAKQSDVADTLSEWISKLMEQGTPSSENLKNILPDSMYAIPLIGASAIGGGVGGYRLANALIQNRKKLDRRGELADAQRDYEEALFSQYNPKQLKTASDSTSGQEDSPLDQLHDQLEKQADGIMDHMRNMYGAYALSGGGLMAILGYLRHRNNSQKVLEKALRRRAVARAQEAPPDMSLVTKPIPVADEEDGDPQPNNPRPRSSWGF